MTSPSCTGAIRFPPLTPSSDNLDEAQLVQYNYLANITKAVYKNTIVTEDADGSLQGPFNMLLYTPTVVQPWVNLQLAVAGLLVPSEAECAVLGILSVTKATYGIYAHKILAEKAGLTASQVGAMLAGDCPSSVTPRQKAIYEVAVKLARTRGPLDMPSFTTAEAVLGQAGILGAIQQSAAFMYASMMLNAGDVCLPAGVEC
ncbi:putative carboxymuconolactone decarboxylase protein [Botrytis fragariae]|uniref:Putative carboxymuconolactone decarboxylase protein n=1 Tax=Botrytis fragariae TaxID=1964551 RepID=A0A8H6AH38_9HELO|nr:putative carboxymuconolactone decarboxylase protein [Botrytis fragariae]KAF5867686.1 putative carboxymuconolactone decarboxylase protein [Botrytis fragariae]